MQIHIGKRLKSAREKAGLTQQQLSSQLGFRDRQTLAAIESGIRKVSADELLLMMQTLDRELEYFTDPFRLDGEGSFSWRASAGSEHLINEFESWAGPCLALYRNIATQDDVRTSPLRISITTKSSYEDTHRAAQWLSDEWELGEIPAVRLEEAIGDRLHALVLNLDAPEGISGAACKLTELSAILINRNEPVGRRNFNLAHELFHLLTWENIKPDHSEDNSHSNKKKRSEELANCFASALLMPESTLRKWEGQARLGNKIKLRSWVHESAQRLHVTFSALLWRLVQLDMLEKDAVVESEPWSVVRETGDDTARRFSLDFVRTLKLGLDEGRISVRRAATLLDLSIDDLADLFREYSIEVPFDI